VIARLFRLLVRPHGWERKSLRVDLMSGKVDTPAAQRAVRRNLPPELLYATDAERIYAHPGERDD
jgi:hypothetical protein